jgi:hypothetical protein
MINWNEIIFTSFIGVILTYVLNKPIMYILSSLKLKIFSFSNQEIRNISGNWETTYWYINQNGEKIVHEDILNLKQYGLNIIGKNIKDKSFIELPIEKKPRISRHEYRMEGMLRNGIFYTGTWKSLKENVTYHGAFQLLISHSGNKISGKWLGLDNPDIINNGEWEGVKLIRINKNKIC